MAHPLARWTGALARALRREQSGFALIEVMVSAILIAVVAVGVLAGLDAAGNTSGRSKARGIAASIAQDDQESMRGQEVAELAKQRVRTRVVNVAGVSYTVESQARPISDTSGGSGCTSTSQGFDYLKIASVVTWPKMRGVAPVKADSLMTPKPGSFGPGEGGLAIQIRDRNGTGVPGITVSISGPKSDSDTTDANGCAFFAYIPAGNYTASFAVAGSVTPDRVTSVSKLVSVPDGAVNKAPFDYDRAGQVTASFFTKVAGVAQAETATTLALSHPSLPAPGAVFYSSGGSPAASITTTKNLFPFSSAYAVFSGGCADANPSKYGQPVATATIAPGASVVVPQVIEPALNVIVRRPPAGTGTPISDASVKLLHRTCAVTFNLTTISSGRLPLPGRGLPYGDYDVCAYDGSRRTTLTNVPNRVEAGSANVDVVIPTTGPTTGPCP